MNDINVGTVQNDKQSKTVFYHDKCSKYDYLIALGCGAIAGLVDIFFVGSPADSALQGWTDEQVDKTVMKFSKICGWSPRSGQEGNVKSAIGFLEKKFPVNYDQRHSGDVNNMLNMSAKNHHLKSLAHSPDIMGLFFSVLNQFTGTSTFLDNGKFISINTQTHELQGGNFASKLFCGMANWFGHIMSDVAGSSGASGRGSGIAIPFFEFFQMCNFGSFQVGQYRNTLSVIAVKVFENGYDFRFGLTMTLPVFLCDLSIKLVWAIKHYFYHKKPLEECIPNSRHDDLRIMLLVGNGTLCIMDGADALIRSGGNFVAFFLRLNLIAWFRLVCLVLREVFIRLGIREDLQEQLEAYKRINEALNTYLKELEKIDFELYRKEIEQYDNMVEQLRNANTEEALSVVLKNQYESLGIKLPYNGDFNDFMNDKSSVLVFE